MAENESLNQPNITKSTKQTVSEVSKATGTFPASYWSSFSVSDPPEKAAIIARKTQTPTQ